MRDKNVLAAANGGFFMKSAGCNTPWGIQIVNGTVNRGPLDVSTSTVYQRWFGVTKAGVPVTGDASTYESTYKGKLQYAIGGRYYGIKDGVYVQAGTLNAYDARTAVGHNANGDIVMMVIPGDDADATEAGATVVDVAQVFMDLDIDVNYMLNLDGGGSTNLIVENTGGSPVLTTPLYSGTSQRAIADIMAIVAD